MKKNFLLFLGFASFILGVTSLVMLLVRINFSFLMWLDAFGPVIGLVLRLIMIFGGIVLFYLVRTDWSKENEELTSE